jgi:hypothetical protein
MKLSSYIKGGKKKSLMVLASAPIIKRLTEMDASSTDTILPKTLPFGTFHRTNSPGRKIKCQLAMKSSAVVQMNWVSANCACRKQQKTKN